MGRRHSHEEAAAVMLAAGLEPLEPYPGSRTPWRCQCSRCGRLVTPAFSGVQQGKGGCKYCAGKAVDPEEAAARMQLAGVEPLVAYPGPKSPWPCRCLSCGSEVAPRYGNVASGQGACKVCATGQYVDPEEAAALMRARQLEPLVPYPGSVQPWPCRCLRCGRTVTPKHHTVRRGQGGCKYCAKGTYTDPAEAVARMRQAGLEPESDFPGATTPWPCRCLRCGRRVTPRYSGIVQGKGGCKYCAGRAVDADEAVADMLRAGLEPLQPYVRSLDPWPSRCTACGREVSPTYAAVKHQGNRCRYCATGGIDLTAPAFVYLVTHPQLGAHKVGIGMVGGPRLALHQKHGWQVYRTVNVPTGEEAYRVESEVLRWLRLDLGLPPFLTPEDMPQRGDTETVEADAVGLPTIWERVIAATAKARRQRGRMASANDTA